MVLYVSFQFGTLYSLEYSHEYQSMDSIVEVHYLVAYHYSPVGYHMGQLRHITILHTSKAPGLPATYPITSPR